MESERPPWIVAIGASGSEGLGDIRELLAALPDALAAVIMIVLHRGWSRPTNLREILARASALPTPPRAFNFQQAETLCLFFWASLLPFRRGPDRLPCLLATQAYRLARLAAKYGPEIGLRDLTERFSHDRLWRAETRSKKGKSACGVYLPDLDNPRSPRPAARNGATAAH